MDFSSKLALMLVQNQDWLILHKDKGGIRGLLQSLGGFSYKRCLYWQRGKRQLMDDALVVPVAYVPFLHRDLISHEIPTKGDTEQHWC